jgi:hypothetical protein
MAKINRAQVLKTWMPVVEKIAGINESASPLAANKKEWIAEYAHNHVMAKSLNEDAQVYNSNGLAYNNLFNTMGIGNPMPAQAAGMTAADQTAQNTYGSADKWPALLPIALQVAAKTIGFDLVNTTPFAGPTGVIPFMDYVYSNSKQPGGAAPYAQNGKVNPETLIGGAANDGTLYDMPAAFVVKTTDRKKAEAVTEFGADDKVVAVKYIGKSRIDANPIYQVDKANTTAKSLLEVFANGECEVEGVTYSRPRLVSMLENHILGYAGAGKYDTDKWSATWMDGTQLFEPMDRATGETQYPRQLSLEMFTKFVTVGTVQVAVTSTQDMVHDLNKQWGVDVMKLLENAGVNEISMTINKHILSRLFSLGWENHVKAYYSEGINLNMTLAGKDGKSVLGTTPAYAFAKDGAPVTETMPIADRVMYGDFHNQDTEFKRVFSNILAAGNVITQRGRRGPANFVVTNMKIATMLQTNAQYGFSPIANTINQTAGSLYPVGTVAGMTVYVDPNMNYEDTRVLVGRKGDKDEPGVHFCPYLLADKVETIAESTMSPKMWIRSRYALVNVGWYPESNYITFYVETPVGAF